MSADVFAPVRWACSVPTMLRADGKADSVAHHVLLGMATFADPDGTSVRPSIAALAKRTYLADITVQRALQRIEKAGLAVREGTVNGCILWRLRMEITANGSDESESRRAARRAAAAERQKKFRARRAAEGVTPSESVTEGGRNALGERYVTPSESVTNALGGRYVTPPEMLNQPIDQPETNQQTNHAPDGAGERDAVDPDGGMLPGLLVPAEAPKPKARKRKPTKPEPIAADHPDFVAFWSVYPKKVGKLDARSAFVRALEVASLQEIVAGATKRADFHAQSGKSAEFAPDPATWLNGQRWEDELPVGRHLRAVANGPAVYTNPTDPSVYEGPL